MDFSSILFLFIFLPCFLVLYYLVKNIKIKNILIVLFSLLFYGYGSPKYVFVIIGLTILNYFFIKNNQKKVIHYLGISFNILSLALCKYVFKVLPLGISFYVFEAISSLVVVFKKQANVPNNIIEYSVYLLSFSKITSGPIEDYRNSFEISNRDINRDKLTDGIRRFLRGLIKKVLLADNLSLIVDKLFQYELLKLGFLGSLLGVVAYSLQLYYDFSGYSDMAIGIGKMMGFNYPENFDHPYSALSITEFWRKWHKSLSNFFRDYVYIPLGGNRVSTKRHIFNLFVVWLLTGLWHGSSFNFVVWGLYYFVILVLEKYWLSSYLKKWPNVIQHIYSIVVILIGWTIFYFSDFEKMGIIFKNLIGINGLGDLSIYSKLQLNTALNIVVIILAIYFSWPHKIKESYLSDIILIVLFVIALTFILSSSYHPFIYAQF